MEQRIKGTTGLLALIGSPVGHSGSPDMYNFCFRYHNLDYSYMAFDIKEDQVPAALDAMRLFKMRGCNVTMPCKTAAACTTLYVQSFHIGFGRVPVGCDWNNDGESAGML